MAGTSRRSAPMRRLKRSSRMVACSACMRCDASWTTFSRRAGALSRTPRERSRSPATARRGKCWRCRAVRRRGGARRRGPRHRRVRSPLGGTGTAYAGRSADASWRHGRARGEAGTGAASACAASATGSWRRTLGRLGNICLWSGRLDEAHSYYAGVLERLRDRPSPAGSPHAWQPRDHLMSGVVPPRR